MQENAFAGFKKGRILYDEMKEEEEEHLLSLHSRCIHQQLPYK